MKFRTGFLVGGALGYYYGAKAGRQRYEQIDAVLDRVRASGAYQATRGRVVDAFGDAFDGVKERTGDAVDRAMAKLLPDEPEPTYEPGLEFNPDFTPTEAEIVADLRGEAPAG